MLFLKIVLAPGMNFGTDGDMVPTVSPTYTGTLQGRPPNLEEEAFVPKANKKGSDTIEFLWSITPQPASETVFFSTWKMKIGNFEKNFDPGWINSITISSHCPEPATWAMLIVGFGGVGWQARRRRAVTA